MWVTMNNKTHKKRNKKSVESSDEMKREKKKSALGRSTVVEKSGVGLQRQCTHTVGGPIRKHGAFSLASHHLLTE